MACLNEVREARLALLRSLGRDAAVQGIRLGVSDYRHRLEVLLQPGQSPRADWPRDVDGIEVTYEAVSPDF